MKALTLTFNDSPIHASHDAWFNATDMAKPFNKRPTDWLKQKDTKEYIALLCEDYEVTQNHFIKTQKGRGKNGTWFKHELAIRFAQWLDARFAIWCDRQTHELLSGERKQLRSDTKAYYRMMADTLQESRLAQGKETTRNHYSNEARLINYAAKGDYSNIVRDNADKKTLSIIKMLESYNSTLIMMGLSYTERKQKLCERAERHRKPRLMASEVAA